MIEIKGINGEVLLSVTVSQDAVKIEELMKQDNIRLSWKDIVNRELPLGAYIEYDDEIYTLLESYSPSQISEAEFEYTPVFHSRVIRWQHIPFFFYNKVNNIILSREPDWVLTDNPANVMASICEAIYQETGERWSYTISNDLPASGSFSFSNIDIFSALNSIANTFKTEWWVDKKSNEIHLSKASIGSAVALTVGGNINVPSVNNSNHAKYTRYYAFGSTRNIEQDYKGANVNTQTNKRLTLDPAKYPNGYKDIRPNLLDSEILVKTLVFDDIYPKSILKIADVRVRLMWRLDQGSNRIQVGTDSEGNPIYDLYAIWYFKIPELDFDESSRISGKALSVNFKSGPLSGRDFELKYYSTSESLDTIDTIDGGKFEVEAGDYEIKFIEEGAYIIPSITGLIPANGNEITLFNIVMPDEYKQSAYVELEQELDKEIARFQSDLNNYSFDSNPVEFFENNPNLSLGRAVKYTNGSYSYNTRVIKLETKLDFPFEQKITIGNEQIKGNTQELKEGVVNANRDINLLASINEMTNSLTQAYQRTQKAVLESLAKYGGWLDIDENGDLYVKKKTAKETDENGETVEKLVPRNFYSFGEVSAGGVGSDTSGNGLLSEVLGADSLGTIEQEDLSKTFSAFAINSIYNSVGGLREDLAAKTLGGLANVDIAADAETETEQLLIKTGNEWGVRNVSEIALNETKLGEYLTTKGYITKTVADGAYAPLAAFNELNTRVTDFLSNEADVDETINRWKELEAFLAGYTETATLADLLSVKADKTTVEQLQMNLGSQIIALNNQYVKLFNYFDLEGNAKNALKLGGVALNELFTSIGSNTGNVISITIGGVTRGISQKSMRAALELGTAAYKAEEYFATAEGLTTLTERVATNEEKIEDVDSRLSEVEKWFTLVDDVLITTYNLAAYGEVSSGGVGSSSSGGSGGGVGNILPHTQLVGYGEENLTDVFSAYTTKLISDKVDVLRSDVNAIQTLNPINLSSMWGALADGSTTNKISAVHIPDLSSKYLPLTGGTINMDYFNGFVINRNTDTGSSLITFSNNGGELGRIGFTQVGVPIFMDVEIGNSYPLLHTGNYTTELDKRYLLSQNKNIYTEILYGSDGYTINELGLYFKNVGSVNGGILRSVGQAATYIWNSGGSALGLSDDNVPFYRSVEKVRYTLLHTGNYASYTLSKQGLASSQSPSVNHYGLWDSYGAYLSIGESDTYKIELRSYGGLQVRRVSGSNVYDWATILETSNYSTTLDTRYVTLATNQTITGQKTFNKSIYLKENEALYYALSDGDKRLTIYLDTAKNLFFGRDTARNNESTYIAGTPMIFRYGQDNEAMRITSSGNVLIGTTTDNGTDKLQVNGSSKLAGKITQSTGSVLLRGATQASARGMAANTLANALGNYATALGYNSYAGVRTGDSNYPYAYMAEYATLPITFNGETVYGLIIPPGATYYFTYNGTERSVTNPSSSYSYVYVLVDGGDDLVASDNHPFNKCALRFDTGNPLLGSGNYIYSKSIIEGSVYGMMLYTWAPNVDRDFAAKAYLYAMKRESNSNYSGNSSVASGNYSVASGNYSVASGNYSVASGNYSVASGYSSVASGYSSVASGYTSVASGYYSVASGYSSVASGNSSVASGNSSVAKHDYSLVTALYGISGVTYQTVIGKYNAVATDAFVIGWGSSDSDRKNIFTVSGAGNTVIGGTLAVSGTSTFTGNSTFNAGVILANSVGRIVAKKVDGTSHRLLMLHTDDQVYFGNTGVRNNYYADDHYFYTNDGTSRFALSLKSNGNVLVGTDNEINSGTKFQVNGAGYFTGALTVGALNANGHILPTSTASYTLGNTNYRWKSAYIAESIVIGGATLTWDAENECLIVDKNFAAYGEVSSGGIGEESVGGAVNLLLSWSGEYDNSYALSAGLGVDLNNRVSTLEANGLLNTNALWTELRAVDTTKVIDKSHIPSLADKYVTIKGIIGANALQGVNAFGYTYATEAHGGAFAGGIISVGLTNDGFQLNANTYGTKIAFRGLDSGTLSAWKELALVDNVYSKTESDKRYLQLTGGKLTKDNYLILSVENTATDLSVIGFYGTSGLLGHLGFNAVNKPRFMDTNGVGYDIVHSGNLLSQIQAVDGSGSGIDADMLDGRQSNRLLRVDSILSTTDVNCDLDNLPYSNSVVNDYRWTNAPVNTIASVLDLNYSNDWVTQIFARHAATPQLYVRSRYNGTTWTDWKTVAFTDSNITGNAASATKLVDNTAYTVWGQKFFENGKPISIADKDIVGVHNITPSATHAYNIGSSSLVFERIYVRFIDTDTGYNLRLCANGIERVSLSATGYVGINQPAPEYQLDVNSPNFIGLRLKRTRGTGYGMSIMFANADSVLGQIGWVEEDSFRIKMAEETTNVVNITSSEITLTNPLVNVVGVIKSSGGATFPYAKIGNIRICCNNDMTATRTHEINDYGGILHLQYNTTYGVSLGYGGGNVGIGASPLENNKLFVAGSIYATGDYKVREGKNIILRPDNSNYIAGIGHDTSGNECIALWAKSTVTRLRWHAGIDLSAGVTSGSMMNITPDFEISKASGTAKGFIGGVQIVTTVVTDLLNTTILEMQETYNGEFSSIRDSIQTLAGYVSDNERAISTLNTNLTALGNQVGEFQGDLSTLSEEIGSVETSLSSSITTLAGTVTSNTEKISTNAGNINTIKNYFTNGVANKATALVDNNDSSNLIKLSTAQPFTASHPNYLAAWYDNTIVKISPAKITVGMATKASQLTVISKTAWGQTYWTDGGIPTSISGDMSNVGNINMSGEINIGGAKIWWDSANQCLRTNYNFAADGEVSSGGVGDDSSGTVSGDYLPLSGGTISGLLNLRGASNSEKAKLNIGSGTAWGTYGKQAEVSMWGILYMYYMGYTSYGSLSYYTDSSGSTRYIRTNTSVGLYAQGDLIYGGSLSAASDINYKDVIQDVCLSSEVIANAPMFTFTWRDSNDGKKYIGTSAQYWLDYAPELTSFVDNKYRLDYATLGVLMGKSNATEIEQLKEKVRVLEEKVERYEKMLNAN